MSKQNNEFMQDDLADIVEELAMINSNIIRNISGQIAQKVFQISEPLIDDFINDVRINSSICMAYTIILYTDFSRTRIDFCWLCRSIY